MKLRFLMAFVAIVFVCAAQAPAPSQTAPDTVVATVDGKPVTAAQIQAILGLSKGSDQALYKNPKGFLTQLALIRYQAEQAEKEGLDKKSPYREQIEFQRLLTLYNAQATEAAARITLDPDAVKKHYEANLDRYRNVTVKAIYIAFTSAPLTLADPSVKKSLSEPESLEKATRLYKEIQSGADFVEMVRKHSDDVSSKSKDGDFGVIRAKDNVAENIRKAIFALKEGQVSEPVRSNNGFYLFKAEKVGVQPLSAVNDEIYIELHQARQRTAFDAIVKSRVVKIEKEDFFQSPQQPAAAAPKAVPGR